MQPQVLENEWITLQNQYDSYEKYSLLIKLVNVGVLVGAYYSNHMHVMVLFLLLVLWGQDAIWKTFQSRIEVRLLELESTLAGDGNAEAFQFNRQYQKCRPGLAGLVKEYACQAIRPTIAYPHAVLLVLLAVTLLW